MVENLKILILEDNESDADLLQRELKKSGLIYTSEIVQTREEYECALERLKPDIILSDYSLPSFDGVTAFKIKQNTSPDIPFIIVSGVVGEENAVELIKNGVTDYALKDKLFVLIPKIIRALKEAEEKKEKKIADEELVFQYEEIEKRSAELIIANKELSYQNDDKEKRALELNIANTELAFQNDEKEKRTEELKEAKIIAEKSVKVKDEFLANMSHEIRTPLNAIIGFARILEGTKVDAKQRQSVEAIKSAGENLMMIINDILDISKIEAKKMTFEEVNFSLSKTVNSVIQLLAPNARDKKIKLLYDANPQINNFLIGDPTRLSQILINLIGNALKFTEKGYVELIVSDDEQSKSDTIVRFSVIDTGIGIPIDKIDSIFESFNQASNETTRKYGGTGLGLTITRKLIELQGGRINVKSEVSKGSEFSFSICYKKGINEIAVSKIDQKEKLNSDFLKDKKILLVEDNDLNQLLAIRVFEIWDKEIDIADSGKTAIEKIQNNNYDIILMDIQMPEMDGIALTRHIRSDMGEKSNIPIIALTANAALEEEKRCLDSGMNDYLSKPYDFNELLEKIHYNLIDSNDPVFIDSPKQGVLVNFTYLNEFAVGDAYFIERMVDVFMQKLPGALEIILDSNQTNNMKILKTEIHKLKSSISLLGITAASKIISIIENEIEINPDGQKRKDEVRKLNEICLQVSNELESHYGNAVK